MGRMKREPTETLTIRIGVDAKRALAAHADAEGRTLPGLARRILEMWTKKRGAK